MQTEIAVEEARRIDGFEDVEAGQYVAILPPRDNGVAVSLGSGDSEEAALADENVQRYLEATK